MPSDPLPRVLIVQFELQQPTADSSGSSPRNDKILGILIRRDPGFKLLRPEDTVACVSQSRHDVPMVVQLIVDRARRDFNVRVFLLDFLNPFRSSNKRNQMHVLHAHLVE